MSTIYDWSLIAGNNATADTDINWAEGQFPSTVNNSARQMMTRVAQWLDDNGVLTVTGTNTIAVTTNSPILTIDTGMTLSFRALATNTTAVTLNVNGLGGKDIRKVIMGGTDSIALDAGDINIKGVYVVHYDATTNGGAGGWILLNPATTSGYLPLAGGTLTGNLVLESTDAGSAAAPILDLYRNSASPAASDVLGALQFNGEDSAGDKQLYAQIAVQINDPVSGSEDSQLNLDIIVAGVATRRLTLSPTGVAFAGTLTGPAIDVSGAVEGGSLRTGLVVEAAGTSLYLATTGAGTVAIRPNGAASSSGQMTVNSAGTLTTDGNIAAAGTVTSNQNFASSTANVVLAALGGSLVFRPVNAASSSAQGVYDISGNFTAAGNVTAFSDRRLKSDIVALEDTGAIIDGIEGKRFVKDGKPSIGFIAQDVQVYLPELVLETQALDEEESTLALSYGNLTAVLWNEVKDLRKRLAALEAK